MIGAGLIVKLGAPGAAGFLLGLGAVAVVQPRTPEGKSLLILTVICLVIVLTNAVAAGARMLRGRGESDGGGGEPPP